MFFVVAAYIICVMEMHFYNISLAEVQFLLGL